MKTNKKIIITIITLLLIIILPIAAIIIAQNQTQTTQQQQQLLIYTLNKSAIPNPLNNQNNPTSKDTNDTEDLLYIGSNYNFTGNVNVPIVVIANNVKINGNGYSVIGPGTGTGSGFQLIGRSKVTIYNVTVTGWKYGFDLEYSAFNNLSGNTANNNGIGFYLTSSSTYNTLSGNTANNGGGGFYLSGSFFNILSGNTATNNNQYGFTLDSISNNNILSNNTVYGYTYYGFTLYSSSFNTLSGNAANSNYIGFYLYSSSNNNTLSGNAANSAAIGFYLFSSSNNNILLGNAANSAGIGFYLFSSSNNNILLGNAANNNNFGFLLEYGSNNNILSGNTANNNTDYGFYLVSSSYSILLNNTANNNAGDGFYLYGSSHNILSGNTANNNSYGFFLDFISDSNLTNNTANNNVHGFYLEDWSYNNILSNNIANSNHYGFDLYSRPSYNTLMGNTANNNYYGFILESSSNYNTLTGNTANNNNLGFYLYDSANNNILSDNTANNNTNYGFDLYTSSYNILSNNIANNNNQYGFYLYSSSNSNTLSGNTANNNNQYGFILSSSSYNTLSNSTANSNTNEGFYLYNSSYNTLSGNNATNVGYGFVLDSGSNNNNLSCNTANNNTYNSGFYLYNSSNNNNLSGNTANNNGGDGFTLYSSSNNTLLSNTANNNTNYGFYLYSSSNNNTLMSNAANNNWYGFRLESSSNYNALSGNTANNNTYGLALVYGSNNNNLSSNTANNNTAGIGLYLDYSANNNTLSNNTANNNDVGFYVSRSSNNTISGNTANNNSGYGFYITRGSNTSTFSGNTLTNDGYGFYLEQASSGNKLLGNNVLNSTNAGYYWTPDSIDNDFTGSVWANYLRVKVIDILGISIPGAEVNVETDGTPVYATSFFGGLNSTTDANGFTPWIAVLYKTFTGNDTMTEHITNVTVWYSFPWVVAEFSNNPRIVDMSTSHVENFQQEHTKVTWTNPTITDFNYSRDLNITLNGDLTITETGELHLINCILNVNNGTAPVQYGVQVYGELYISNSSIITAINSTNPYYFTVYENAVFQMNNSLVEYCGDSSGSWPDQQGFTIYADNAWIENNTITQGYYGLILYNSQGSTILNNTATNNNIGFYLVSSSNNNLLSGNTANSNTNYGFYLVSSSNNNLTSNTANSNTNYGFYLVSSSNNNLLSGNTANNNYDGFYLYDSSYNTFSGNTANYNTNYGFYIDSSSNNNLLSGNTANNNYNEGFHMWSSSYNTLSGNTAKNNWFGFFLWSSSNNNLSGNTANNNGLGFTLEAWSNNNLLSGNTANNNQLYGFYSQYIFYNTLSGNTANNNSVGFYLIESSNNNNLSNNTANNNADFGFILSSSSNNNLSNNTANNNIGYGYHGTGFLLSYHSNNNTLTGNTANNNNGYGFYLSSSLNNILTGNTANNNEWGGFVLSGCSYNTLSGNTANNNIQAGFSLGSASNNNNLTGNTANGNSAAGLYLQGSSNNTLSDNTANNNTYGFYLSDSSYNTLSGNTANNNRGYGFILYPGSYNNLSGNAANNNGQGGFYLIFSSYNTLSGNAANNNNVGLDLYSSTYNILSYNFALNCTTGYHWSSDSSNNDYTGSVWANYLSVKVLDIPGLPFLGAEINVETDGTQLYATPHFNGSNSTTDMNGFIPWIVIPYKTGTGIDQMTGNNTNITVYYKFTWTLAKFSYNPRTVDMSTSHVENFQQQYTNETWTNPTINVTNNSQYLSITLNGDLTITETGELHLIHCILNVNNGSLPVQYGVQVYGGLYINESSVITAINPANPYYFTVYENAIFQMNNSRVQYCGHSSGSWPDQQGFTVKTNNTWIENNTITQGYYGLILCSSQGSTILNNNATNNYADGFYLYQSSYNILSNNNATNNYADGFYLRQSSNNSLSINIANNNGYYGFYLNQSSNNNTLSGNIALNCVLGYNWSSDSINNDFTGSVWINYLRVKVTDTPGQAISGADVNVTTDGIAVYATPYFKGSDPRTDSNGFTPWIAVLYKTFTGNDTMTEDNTTVTVSNSTVWFFDNQRTVSMSMSHVETFIADTIPPSVTITSPSSGALIPIASDVGVTWNGSDNGFINHYEVMLDGGSWINVGNNTSYPLTGLPVGRHTVYVRAFDMSYNYATDSVSFSVGPDFAISPQSISFVQSSENTYVYATVTNLGADYTGQMGPITVIFYDITGVSTWIGSSQINSLSHGGSSTVNVKWATPQESHKIKVIINPGSSIKEIDETNNVAQLMFPGHRPIIQDVSSTYGFWDGSSVGTFLTGLGFFGFSLDNTFTANVSDQDGAPDVSRVIFLLNGKDCPSSRRDGLGSSQWDCVLSMSDLIYENNFLTITAVDKWGMNSETKVIIIQAKVLPTWIQNDINASLKLGLSLNKSGWSIEWNPLEQTISISKTIPSKAEPQLEGARQAPSDIPATGGDTDSSDSWFSLKFTYHISQGVAQVTGGGQVAFKIGGYNATATIIVDAFLKPDLSFDNATVDFTVRIPLYSRSGSVDVTIIPYIWTLKFSFGVEFGVIISIEAFIQAVSQGIKLIYALVDLGVWGRGWLDFKVDWGWVGGEISAQITASIDFVVQYYLVTGQLSVYLEGNPGLKIEWKAEGHLGGLKLEVSGSLEWKFKVASPGVVNFTSEEGPLSIVQDNTTLMDSRPRVAADANGNAMMVWCQNTVVDNITYSDICYSIWNGTGWGTPGFITFDKQADFDPALTYDSNGNVIVIWSRITGDLSVFTPDDPLAIFGTQEIFYSIWNKTTSTWSTSQQLTSTNNTYSNGRAVVAAGPNGQAMVIWVRDLDHNFTTTNDMNLYYSVWDGTQWTPEAPLTNNTCMNYEASLAYDSKGNAIACWISDQDGNPATYWDRELRYSIWNGTSWSQSSLVPELNESKDNPSVTFDQNGNALVTWVGGDTLANRLYFTSMDKTTGTWSQPEIVREDTFFIYDPVINVDSKNTAVIVWRGFEPSAADNFGGDICYATKNLSDPNAIWSEVKYLTNNNETNWMLSACITPGANNSLVLVWDKEGVVSNLTHSIKPDLALDSSDITFSNNYPSEGQTVNITAGIHNIGDADAYNVLVNFYDGDPNDGGQLIGTQSTNYLSYDGEVNITCPWTATKGTHNIYVVIDPLGSISEITKTNNVAYNTIGILPDLSISTSDITFSKNIPYSGKPIKIFATIYNQGGTAAENVLVQFYSNGIPIGGQTISSLAANGHVTVSMTWTVTGGQNNITVAIDPNNEIAEWSKDNNVASTTISVLPDLEASWLSLSEHELLPGENVTITAEIQNIGNADATGVTIEFFDGNPYINGTLIYNKTVNLPLMGTHTSSFVWTPTQGIHQVFVVVNRGNLIAETNQINNVQYDTLEVELVPDLTVLVPWFTMESGYVTIIAPIQNIGEAGATGVVIGLYDGNPAAGGVMINGALILSIAPGETVNVSLTVYQPPKNEYLYIVVDPNNTITESNKTNNIAAIKYTPDLTPPITTIYLSGTPGLNNWFLSPITVNLTAWDDLSGVNVTEYSFDNTTWNIYTGPFTITTEGVTTLYYNSTDNAGNVENTNTEVIMIDTTPPVTSISPSGTPGLNGWYTSDVNISLTASDNVSGVNATEYSFDNTTWNTYSGPFTISSEGITTVYYRSIDNAGNVENTNTEAIMIDKTPPETSIILEGTPGLNGWYTSDVTANLTATDNVSGVSNTEYSIDGTNWFNYTGRFTISTEGITNLYYRSTDNAGNVEETNTEVIMIDKTPPVTAISLSGILGLNGWYLSTVNLTLSPIDETSGENITEYSSDGINWITYTEPFTITTEGITTIYYRSTDNAGNVEVAKSETVKIDKTNPTTTISLDGALGLGSWYVTNVMVNLSATDGISGSGVNLTNYSFDNINWITYTGPFTITDEGITTIYYCSTDNAGNVEATKTQIVKIDKTPPVTTINLTGTQGNGGWYVSDVSVTLSATDATSGVYITEYSFDNTTWTVYTGSFTITAEGITTVYYRSTDNAGNVETAKSETIWIDKTPPTTELIIGTHYVDGNGSIYVTSSTEMTLKATDAVPGSGVANTYYRINSGNWTEYVGAFNITDPIGTYTIDYYSVDCAGNKETPKTTTVIMEEAFQGCGRLLIGKQWFKGNATLFLSEHMIRIQVGDQIATWNIVKHCRIGHFEFYYGEGALGKIVLMIHRGETSTNVLAIGGGVFFCSCTKTLTTC